MIKLNMIPFSDRDCCTLVLIPFDETQPYIEVTEEEYELINQGKLICNKEGKLIPKPIFPEEEIYDLKKYLADTDYIISKLNELKLEDEEEYEIEKQKYSDILAKRKEARVRIRELENNA